MLEPAPTSNLRVLNVTCPMHMMRDRMSNVGAIVIYDDVYIICDEEHIIHM